MDKTRRGNIKRGKDGNRVKTKQPRKKGRVREDFLKKDGLSHNSAADFVSPFLPFKSGAVEGGYCYYYWKPFSARELRQHFGLYLFNGLAPSPSVEQKFKPQSQDPFHGNDFIYHMFGPNSKRRHRHFKTFLAIQDPAI